MDESKTMRSCDEYCVQLALYLDDELDNDEKRAFETHLKGCRVCRKRLSRERRLIGHLRKSVPLYTAPDGLRAQVKSIIDAASDAAPLETKPELPLKTRTGPSAWFSGIQLFTNRTGFAALLTSMLVVVGLWGVAQVINPTQSFAAVAVDTHQRYILGRLPLELASQSPKEISQWFNGKVPFSLKLPNYPEVSGQEKLYSLKGARLIGFKDDYAAYVAYEMEQHPISLVVTSSANTKPEGGEQIASQGLVFHYDTMDGLKVITWAHRGLTYALVSDFEERGQQSCLVCHQDINDQGIVDDLDSIQRIARSK